MQEIADQQNYTPAKIKCHMVFTIGLLTSQCQGFFRVFFFYKAKALRTKQVGFTYPVCLTLTSAKACIIVF